MSLADHAIWWQVYPLGATGAPIRRGTGGGAGEDVSHRLRALDAWWDYAIDLGCSGLLLGPVFASTSHGYDTVDHYRVDPRLGDDADLDHLIATAASRGMAVMLDGVFNHVGREHPLVSEAGNRPPGSGLIRYERRDGASVPQVWEGHGDLVVLDHDDPRIRDLVTDVMLHWLRRGIAGWRLDVAYAVPADFWREVLGRVRAEFPQALFLGEVIHGDYAAVGHAATLDAVTQYELWKGIWSSLVDRNMWELAWALERHERLAHELVMQTFVGNHDVDRIAGMVGDAGAVLALVVLMTVPGMPSVYYGDEQAFRGRKGEGFGADDAIRPPLPASPEGLAPQGWWMYRMHQECVGLRRRNAWLARAHLLVTGRDNSWIEYESAGDGHVARVRLDLAAGPGATVHVDGVECLRWKASEPGGR